MCGVSRARRSMKVNGNALTTLFSTSFATKDSLVYVCVRAWLSASLW